MLKSFVGYSAFVFVSQWFALILSSYSYAADLVVNQSGIDGYINTTVVGSGAESSLDIEQQGEQNRINLSVNQQSTGAIMQDGIAGQITLEVIAEGNIFDLQQSGNNNVMDMLITGSANRTYIEQTNSGNNFDLNLGGSYYLLNVNQAGNRNTMLLSLNSGGASLDLEQIGDNNNLELTQQNSSMSLTIMQSGDDDTLIINQ